MARVVRRRWQSSLDGGLPRTDRQGCEYEAYVPDTLGGRDFRLNGTVAAGVADAERAIAILDASAAALANTEALARLLLRAECFRRFRWCWRRGRGPTSRGSPRLAFEAVLTLPQPMMGSTAGSGCSLQPAVGRLMTQQASGIG